MFQFLIGTLKTTLPADFRSADSHVSIPHRYAKNHDVFKVGLSRYLVSIPHRYAKNDWTCRGFRYEVGVSIPHRYAKNLDIFLMRNMLKFTFQFLIGTLKTR